MKSRLFTVSLLLSGGLLSIGSAQAGTHVDVGVNIGVPAVVASHAPVIVPAAAVVVQPRPVYVQPAPVYVERREWEGHEHRHHHEHHDNGRHRGHGHDHDD